jgi:hypothetical protein
MICFVFRGRVDGVLCGPMLFAICYGAWASGRRPRAEGETPRVADVGARRVATIAAVL